MSLDTRLARHAKKTSHYSSVQTNKSAHLTKYDEQHIRDAIAAAIDDECGYEKDNITAVGWYFLQNEAPDIIFDKISLDYVAGDFDSINDINEDVAYSYLQSEINDYEEEHGNIRSYC